MYSFFVRFFSDPFNVVYGLLSIGSCVAGCVLLFFSARRND